MKRAEQLKSLKMPKQKMAEDEAALDLDMIGSEEEPMPAEGEDMPEGDMPEVSPASEMLSDVSDDELLAELKKRGLVDEGTDAPEAPEAPEEMEEGE